MQTQEESFIQEFENTNTTPDNNFFKKRSPWIIGAVAVLILAIIAIWPTTKSEPDTNEAPVPAGQQHGPTQPVGQNNTQKTPQPTMYKAKFFLEANKHDWAVGDEVDVQIEMDTMGNNIVAAQAVVEFNPEFLEFIKANHKASVLTMDVIEKSEDNKVEVVRGIPGDSDPKDNDDGFAGVGNFSILKFKVIKKGNFSLAFDRHKSMIVVDDGKGTVMQTEFSDLKF